MNTAPTSPAISFGTDGIRGHADSFPFDNYTLRRIGYATALWAIEKYAVAQPRILLGMDTRVSGCRIKAALIEGLVQGGALAVDGGVLPTPAVCNLIHYDERFHAGVVISASHNPYFDNGIKVFDARRCKLLPRDEERLLNVMNACRHEENLLPLGAGRAEQWEEAGAVYVRNMVERFVPRFLAGKTIVLDMANGATAGFAETIFTQLGARVIPLADHPTGLNINENCGALHPASLQQAVVAAKADAGFAFDGDGDRIIAVNAQGEVKDGDDILFLLLSLPTYRAASTVVGTVMSNQGLAKVLQDMNKTFVRTAVGDKYVAAGLEEYQVLLGAEISGHVILKDYLLTGDGIFVALKVLEALALSGNWSMLTFPKFPQKLVNVRVGQKKDLGQEPFAGLIQSYQARLRDGRLLVRYSGTEPVLRVMAEAATATEAEMVAKELAEQLSAALAA